MLKGSEIRQNLVWYMIWDRYYIYVYYQLLRSCVCTKSRGQIHKEFWLEDLRWHHLDGRNEGWYRLSSSSWAKVRRHWHCEQQHKWVGTRKQKLQNPKQRGASKQSWKVPFPRMDVFSRQWLQAHAPGYSSKLSKIKVSDLRAWSHMKGWREWLFQTFRWSDPNSL